MSNPDINETLQNIFGQLGRLELRRHELGALRREREAGAVREILNG